VALRKHGGLKEILETGEAPGCIIHGDRKGKSFTDIDPRHRVCADTGGGVKNGKPIPVGSATLHGIGEQEASNRERAHQKNLDNMRKAIKSQGGQKKTSGGWKLTHSIPAELYYGKIKETGDKNFWNDPKKRDASGGKMPE
jgi:hypothetical protein